ncbi:S1C family serine protease [Anaerorhabdus furcosa]|uniref:Serine protease Do n=1 Tax=Anaerorhabdus furcosa TaxID=118967 RepID=A0A1T4NFH7_9FIRM|nr:trypsin-like peptidase domain-containing protein [Anaerorhabdus furcosa]SJZ78022.1 serine protease Do [Anaerorhabdus furcosa]
MFESKNDKLINKVWNETENKEKQEEMKTEEVREEVKVESEPVKESVKVERKEPKNYSTTKLLVSVALVAGTFGFGGSYLANQIQGPRSTIVQNSTSNIANTSLGSDGLSMQKIIENTAPSVVEIRTETVSNGFMLQEYVSEGAGSGVVLTSDGYIVTNNHVINNARNINVTLSDGTTYVAELIGTDPTTDLAVIKVDAKGLSAAVIGNSDNLKVGDGVIAIGNPLGTLGGSATDGIISALNREITIDNETMNLLQTNAAVNPGNSGGGLFNGAGELIGIVNAKSSGSDVEGLGFAIPSNDVVNVADQLINNGYVSNRATIGVYLSEVTQNNGQVVPGLYISEVIEGSGAQKAGLQAYDRIIFVGDTEITSYSDLKKIIKEYNVGDTIQMTVVRDGKQIVTDVTLTESKQ